MPGFKLVEERFRRPPPSRRCIRDALPGSFSDVDARGNAEQALIGFSILDDGCRPHLDRKHHRPLALLGSGATAERGQQSCRPW
jgi:hypothetical protein